MFNFVDSKLTPKIVSKAAAMDNYEVENLISSNYLERMRGFIAYSAIKPPVEIEITLICPVNIHYIVLNTTVGSQKCSGIEIFAKNTVLNYTSICRSVYDKAGIVFCNSRKYSNSNLPSVSYKNYHLAFFKSNTFKNFLNASCLKIIIFRTEKSVPCLGAVEVWGTPSKSCSATTVRTINYIMQKTYLSESVGASSCVVEDFKIPDDFKDDLTYEIMSVPMTLPSGKTIDQSTLEKHVNSEISFGRKPCDPFTGIKFTEKIKPILNVALKSRIDMFVLQNSHREELFGIKRTVGRANSNACGENTRKRKMDNCSVDDLDELISRAKQSPNFLNFTNGDLEMSSCTSCGTSSVALYEILCQHRYCRACMLDLCKVLRCKTCNNSFTKGDVKKCNL